MKLLLHIGMPKCGSSALQTYLSRPDFSRDVHGRCAYVSLNEDGSLFWGESLHSRAANSAHGYCSSHQGKSLSALSAKQRKQVLSQLTRLGHQYDTLILSNEGWGPNPDHFSDDFLFADTAFDVTVLAYVRPQVEWMNSAWWQWGAWTNSPLHRWVNRNRPKALWYKLIQQWSAKPWVSNVDVRLLDGDVVQEFMAYLGYRIPARTRTNQSLPEAVLRLFQRNRQLRPGPHDSAIEFALTRHLQLEAGKNPWILKTPWVEKLIDFYLEDNKQLINILPSEQQQVMRGDSRWWRADAYSSKIPSPAMLKRLDLVELERLAVAALEAVNHLDDEIRRLNCLLSSNKRRQDYL